MTEEEDDHKAILEAQFKTIEILNVLTEAVEGVAEAVKILAEGQGYEFEADDDASA